jgi:hypothetical protein
VASLFALYNSTNADQWFILRCSTKESRGKELSPVTQGVILRLPVNGNKVITLEDGEVVTSFSFNSKAEAEASIGQSEKHKFEFMEATS